MNFPMIWNYGWIFEDFEMLIELWYWRFSNYRYSNYLMMKILSSSIFPYIYTHHCFYTIFMDLGVFPWFFPQFSSTKLRLYRPGTHGSPPAAFQPPLRSRWRSLSTGKRSPWRRAPGTPAASPADEETEGGKKGWKFWKKCGKHVESIRNLREKWWTMWIMVDIHQRNDCENRNKLI